MIKSLAPFFSGYIWQLNFNLLAGLVFLTLTLLFVLNFNLLLQMPDLVPSSFGPFVYTKNFTAGWGPIFQLVILFFVVNYVLNFIQLTNANVTALWYFEESAEQAVHEPLLRSLKRSLKRTGVLIITTFIAPLVLITEIFYWLLFSGRPL